MPLGSGALAGVAYNIDRNYVARELGFSQISRTAWMPSPTEILLLNLKLPPACA